MKWNEDCTTILSVCKSHGETNRTTTTPDFDTISIPDPEPRSIFGMDLDECLGFDGVECARTPGHDTGMPMLE